MENRHARQNEFKRGEMPPVHSDAYGEKKEGEKYPPGGKEPKEAAWPAPRQDKAGDKALNPRPKTTKHRRPSSKKGTAHAKKAKQAPKRQKRSAASAKKRR